MAETVAISAVAIAAAASAGTAIYSGIQQREAADAQAAQYEEERMAARTAAQQEEAAKQRQLNRVLGAADALRAGRGLELMSTTGEEIRRENIDAVNNDITTIRANANTRTRRLGLAADNARGQGDAALIGGYGRAVGSLASGVTSAYGIMNRAQAAP
ncbi:hypothetical protein [Neoroseomonas oryzicola]|uniref:Uncharacterized protein n=1 Tax=Neoroseomonas oryzicola TaxID=535904 RepID=A0A9X9WLX4_9PROT|nr:hypothetical protein [Neoroseomonas oryzicola]MBR0661334.1 hypothetical protein [Neoroseomonas oryzicola]NKE18824.1 hypothetical protein [Neoroseomonas oryzicola]